MRHSFLVAFGVGLGLAGCEPADAFVRPVASVPEMVVERGNIEDRLVLTGEIDAADSVELSVPRTDDWNIAIRWLAEDGSEVKAGERVVEFDTTAVLDRISERELAAIEASVDLATARATSEVEVADKRIEVKTQETEVAKAELDTSVPADLLSRREARDFAVALSRAKVALTTARGEQRKVQDGGKLEAEVKRIAYDKAVRAYESAGHQLESLVLEAPRDGIVIIGRNVREGRKLQVGDNLWPGITVARLPDLSKMVVEASLSDVDEGRIHAGMRAKCVVDAFPDRPISGVIRGVSPVAQEQGRQTTRRFFSVVIELEDAERDLLRPGLSVKAEIITRKAEDVVLAPRGGLDLTVDPPQARMADGRQVEVVIDSCDPQACAIVSGLEEGDRLTGPEDVP